MPDFQSMLHVGIKIFSFVGLIDEKKSMSLYEKAGKILEYFKDGTLNQKIRAHDPALFGETHTQEAAYKIYKDVNKDIDNIDKYPRTM